MFRLPKTDISIRRIHIWLLIVLVIMSGTVVFSTYRLTLTFSRITSAYKENDELQKAARELMDASDYLTEQVQRFTINGDMRFLDQYFAEAFEHNRRENAVSKMNLDPRAEAAFEQLQDAMGHSIELMDQEYYAMRLVIEAKGYTDYPELLGDIKLSSEDAALSPEDKIRHATELVLNDDYYRQKDNIRRDMRDSLEEIDKLARNMEEAETASLERDVIIVRTVILLFAVTLIFMLVLTTRLQIRPILKAVDMIKADSPVPEVGSSEFKYLAHAYNSMYSKNKKSIESLNFKASHDELTGAYNRAGYDFLLSNIDIPTTYMMLFDVDNFKKINDTYGHETGDKALIKLVNIMKSVFRDDDCICRIGGDEFVVFMVHSAGMPQKLIESKIRQINEELEKTDDGLPPISISVGIVNGKDAENAENLFEKTDAAMYESKKQGKHTYTFV